MLGLRRAQRRAVAAATPHSQTTARRGNKEHDRGDGVATVSTPGPLAGLTDQGFRRLNLSRIEVGGEASVE
jgi:hypothetical protein